MVATCQFRGCTNNYRYARSINVVVNCMGEYDQYLADCEAFHALRRRFRSCREIDYRCYLVHLFIDLDVLVLLPMDV